MRSLISALAAVLSLVLMAPPAGAETKPLPEGIGDVSNLDGIIVPSHTNGDISSATVSYDRRSLQVNLNFVELANLGPHDTYMLMVLVKGRRQIVAMHSVDANGTETVAMRRIGKRKTRRAKCPVNAAIDANSKAAYLSLPSRCFGAKKYVKVQVGLMAMKVDDSKVDINDPQSIRNLEIEGWIDANGPDPDRDFLVRVKRG